MTYVPTSEIVSGATYKSSPKDFFGLFSASWDAARCQVAKLETRQTYQEPDSDSLRVFIEGDEAKALQMIESSRKDDDELYRSVRERSIEFVRCRPIAFPMSDYLRWEVAVYNHNQRRGERIFWCNLIALSEFFQDIARHDFMVFDTRTAYVHDYDKTGLIQGGWHITDAVKVSQLLSIFAFVKANSQPIDLIQSA